MRLDDALLHKALKFSLGAFHSESKNRPPHFQCLASLRAVFIVDGVAIAVYLVDGILWRQVNAHLRLTFYAVFGIEEIGHLHALLQVVLRQLQHDVGLLRNGAAYISKLFLFSKKSISPIIRMPFSLRQGLILSFTMTIFLKESSILTRDWSS